MQIRLIGEDPRALSWIKDAYVVPQYQILGLCQPRLHTVGCLASPPSFLNNLCSQTNLQPQSQPRQKPRPRDGGTAQWVKALPSLKT